jgi:uncharacterized protein YhfF
MDKPIPHPDFWRRFRAKNPIADADARFYDTVHGDDSMAVPGDGVDMILSGDKTASSALLADYRASGRGLPRQFDLSILLDSEDRPVAVIETVEIVVERFAEIDDSFARAHGGGQSLKSWRRQCRAAFAPRARQLGTPFGEETELVCHRFRVVYVPRDDAADPAAAIASAADDSIL